MCTTSSTTNSPLTYADSKCGTEGHNINAQDVFNYPLVGQTYSFQEPTEKGPRIETHRPNLSRGQHRRLRIQGAESGLVGDPDVTSWLMLFLAMVVTNISLRQESSGRALGAKERREDSWQHTSLSSGLRCVNACNPTTGGGGTATTQLPGLSIRQFCILVAWNFRRKSPVQSLPCLSSGVGRGRAVHSGVPRLSLALINPTGRSSLIWNSCASSQPTAEIYF